MAYAQDKQPEPSQKAYQRAIALDPEQLLAWQVTCGTVRAIKQSRHTCDLLGVAQGTGRMWSTKGLYPYPRVSCSIIHEKVQGHYTCYLQGSILLFIGKTYTQSVAHVHLFTIPAPMSRVLYLYTSKIMTFMYTLCTHIPPLFKIIPNIVIRSRHTCYLQSQDDRSSARIDRIQRTLDC